MEKSRNKMHIWGEGRVQRVIFADERKIWEARGWRDHPNKVGKPLEVSEVEEDTSTLPPVEMPSNVQSIEDTDVEEEAPPLSVNAFEGAKSNKVRRKYTRRS